MVTALAGPAGRCGFAFAPFWKGTPRHLEYMFGETVDGNPGHTIVLPVRPLPEIGDMLAEQVWEYCETPRAQSKITGRFRRHGDPQVMQAVRTLEKQGRLRAVSRGARQDVRSGVTPSAEQALTSNSIVMVSLASQRKEQRSVPLGTSNTIQPSNPVPLRSTWAR